MTEKIISLTVKDFVVEGKAVSSDDGDIIYNKIIDDIEQGYSVELDFSEISMMTTAFLNSAIGQLYSKYSSAELNRYIKLTNVASEDYGLFKKVINRAKEFFKDRKGFEDSANEAIYGR